MAIASIGGNVVGIDPHKRTLSACVVNPMGAVLGVEHFNVSGVGHRALEAWMMTFGPVARIGIEGAGGLGRHTSVFFTDWDYDVRDVCPTRTAERSRQRRRGKSDTLDAERIARETLAEPGLPRAFKLVEGGGPDPIREVIGLWHGARRSVAKIRQQLLGEAEALLHQLPESLRGRLPSTKKIRPRLDAAAQLAATIDVDPVNTVRFSLLASYAEQITVLDAEERRILRELRPLITAAGSTLEDLCGIATKSAAEIFVEVGDPRRFTRAASPGSTAPHRSRLHRGRATENRYDIGLTGVATAESTPCYTAWPSPNSAATPQPARSSTTPAGEDTPNPKPCASSNATSPTSSTAA